MVNVKEIKAVVQQIAETRQLPEDAMWSAIEAAFGAAYKREYGKSDQIIRSRINRETGEANFFQVKQVVDEDGILPEDESPKEENETRVRFNPERHIMVSDARLVRQGVTPDEEILFPLETKSDFGRIAAQSARQAVTQKIYEAERDAAIAEFHGKENQLVHGQVQRIERGNVYVDLGRTVAILPYAEQIRSERFRQGDTIRAIVKSIDTSRRRGGFVHLSRASALFVIRLFEAEVPELAEGTLEVKRVARDPSVRTKIAVESKDPSVDPVGAFIGQRGVRVMTVKSEMGGEQIDIISWSETLDTFIAEALLPAEVMAVKVDGEKKVARVRTSDDQIPVAIGRGGQNISLAARITGTDILIVDTNDEEIAISDSEGTVTILKQQAPAGQDERGSEHVDEGEGESDKEGDGADEIQREEPAENTATDGEKDGETPEKKEEEPKDTESGE